MPFLLLKGLGNNKFPKWNPQEKFIFSEENRLSPENCLQFCTGTDLFILLSFLVEIPFRRTGSARIISRIRSPDRKCELYRLPGYLLLPVLR